MVVANSDDRRTVAAGRLLRRWRRARLLSQEALAERSGLSVRTVRELEAGRIRQPRLSSLGLLVGALGLDEVAAFALTAAFISD
jgi:transcriptional regulator with XRE-family HTH domain